MFAFFHLANCKERILLSAKDALLSHSTGQRKCSIHSNLTHSIGGVIVLSNNQFNAFYFTLNELYLSSISELFQQHTHTHMNSKNAYGIQIAYMLDSKYRIYGYTQLNMSFYSDRLPFFFFFHLFFFFVARSFSRLHILNKWMSYNLYFSLFLCLYCFAHGVSECVWFLLLAATVQITFINCEQLSRQFFIVNIFYNLFCSFFRYPMNCFSAFFPLQIKCVNNSIAIFFSLCGIYIEYNIQLAHKHRNFKCNEVYVMQIDAMFTQYISIHYTNDVSSIQQQQDVTVFFKFSTWFVVHKHRLLNLGRMRNIN